MKINKVQNVNVEKIKGKENIDTDSIMFTELLTKKRDKQTLEKLNKLIEDIRSLGKDLVEKRTVDNLLRYKKMIREFKKEAMEYSLRLEKQGGFRRGGRTKILKIVKKVDEKLIQLTDEVLSKEKKGLNILKLVGEIEGLLIDIYT
ncbi:YaaR family protein [Caldisalinibacter kiritimatiensis]|uniref:DUF327 domain-containing protein n=1 Tax=Caldisalinibacter kiritimatiensis TaxID=1304284 RepID=R1CEU4_9FIRM|nr:YaaR family protein [Caldisalinibacter kiritimatiensis]EOD00830.1 hypothetical protein L21TH_1106 [Caldisalinibacter kiritimatiensis]